MLYSLQPPPHPVQMRVASHSNLPESETHCWTVYAWGMGDFLQIPIYFSRGDSEGLPEKGGIHNMGKHLKGYSVLIES